MSEHSVDVFICGGGPVGLLLSYQLKRMGLSTYTVEQFDKTQQAMYGRASTLYPRTVEMLDQLDLMDEMSQVGFIGRGSATFNGGKRVHGRGWDFISRMYDTQFDYCLNIRQKYSENIFRARLESLGGEVHAGAVLKQYQVDENASSEYPVTASVEMPGGGSVKVKAKYIVGADGGKSSVRHLSGIPFVGERTEFHWIRIDAVIKTDMPSSRIGFGAIESSTHGNVLWVALDHGRTRIGFAMSSKLYEEHGESISEEFVIEEARKALAPFTLEFVTVDWWTLYSIGQRVAETFQKHRVILAGDAGHTHSSGAAQGMNTGMHDAVNLGWKLAGVIHGWYRPEVLNETYSSERRALALHLIELDKTVSALISGQIPDGISNTHGGDANLVLDDLFESSAQFTTGLGVSYNVDGLLNAQTNTASVQSGHRGPDVLVRKPGSKLPTQLFTLTKNNAKFWIIVFAGDSFHTLEKLKSLRTYLDSSMSFVKKLTNVFNFLTVIAGQGLQPAEALGVDTFGYAYYDVDHSAHTRYGMTASDGGVVVLRPDGILSFAAGLDEGAKIGDYFQNIVTPKLDQALSDKTASENDAKRGEIDIFNGGKK